MQKPTLSRIAILTVCVLAGILVLWIIAISRVTPARPVPVVLAERPKLPTPQKPPDSAGLSYLEVQRPDWFSKMGIGKRTAAGKTPLDDPESQAIFAAFLTDLLQDDANGDGLLTGAEVTCATERGYPKPLLLWMFKAMRERADADQDGQISAAEQRQFCTTIGMRQSNLPIAADGTSYDADKDGRFNRQERALAAAQLDPDRSPKSLAGQRQPYTRQPVKSQPEQATPPKPVYFTAANRKLSHGDFPADAWFLPASLAINRGYSIYPSPFNPGNLAAPDPLAALADGDGNGWIDDRESLALFWAILKAYDRDNDGQVRGREQRTLDEDLVFDEALCRFFPDGDKDHDGWLGREETLALLPPILKVYDFNHNGRLDPWEKFRFSRDTWKAQPGTGLALLCEQGRQADRQLEQGQQDSILAELRRHLVPMMMPAWNKEEQETAWQALRRQADANLNGELELQELFEIEQELVLGLNMNQELSRFILQAPGASNSRSPKALQAIAARQKAFQETDTDGNGIISLAESDARRKQSQEEENNSRNDTPHPFAHQPTPPPMAHLDIDGEEKLTPFDIFCHNLQAGEFSAYSSPGTRTIPRMMNQSFDAPYAAFLDWNHDTRLTGAEAKAARAIFLVLFDLNGDGLIDENEANALSQHGFQSLPRNWPASLQPPETAARPTPIFQPPVLNEPVPSTLKNAFETLSGSAKTRTAMAAFLNELMKNDRDGDGRLEDDETTVLIGQGMRKIFFQRLDQQLCRFDLNGDGKISPQERELFLDLAGGPASTVHAWISRLDQNGDGRLNHQERSRFSSDDTHPFAASAGLRVAIPQDEQLTFFLNYRKNSRLLSGSELKNSLAELVLLPSDDICRMVDKDQDGWLNPEETMEARRATFLAADLNGNGWIDIEEAEAWSEAAGCEAAVWRFFPDADANQDGWLDQAEIAQVLPKLLTVYDFNNDGQLDEWERNCLARHIKMANLPANVTLVEMKRLGCAADAKQFQENTDEIIHGLHRRLTYLGKHSQMMVNPKNWQSLLQIADRNGNGRLDLAEAFWLDRQYIIHGEETQSLRNGIELYLDACDTDGDGAITGNELFLAHDKLVGLLDQDGNGFLSIAERQPLRLQAGKSRLRIAKQQLIQNFFGQTFSLSLLFRSINDNGEKNFSKFLMPYLDLDKDGKITMWEIQSFDARFSSKNRLSGVVAQTLDVNLAKAVPFLDRDHDGKLTAAEKNTAIGILLALADKERLGRIDIGTVEVAHKEFPAFDDPVAVPRRDVGRLVRRKLTEQELLQRYDLDGDGKLSPEERARATEDMKNDVENNILVPPEEE